VIRLTHTVRVHRALPVAADTVIQVTFRGASRGIVFPAQREGDLMKRLFYCAALMLLSSSAYANSYSFVVGGHLIRIDAPRHCYSRSCISVSTDGTRQTRRDRDDAADTTPDKAPAKPAAPSLPQVTTPPAAPPAGKPTIEPVASAPPPPAIAAPKLAAAPVPTVMPPPATSPMRPAATPAAMPPPAPPVTPPAPPPAAAIVPAPETSPKVLKVSRATGEEPAETPLGDWQTEGKKGLVRIEQCGPALCGYVLNAATDSVGETVLNVKPKSAALWSGNIYSRDSGSTYYATMTQKSPNSLRVEACVLGRFFCSGNVWTRLAPKREEMITSRQTSSGPKS
jgi:uncharacterized protein (DUF2147 family)